MSFGLNAASARDMFITLQLMHVLNSLFAINGLPD